VDRHEIRITSGIAAGTSFTERVYNRLGNFAAWYLGLDRISTSHIRSAPCFTVLSTLSVAVLVSR